MVIFKQSMMKYLKAPSTWIILIVSLFISGFLAGYLPFDATLSKGKAAKYGYSVLMSTGVMTTMVSMFSSIFAGFKGASMFRDEIESGTFLVLLSKPISRTKIIMQKWLALQAIMVLYSLSNIIVYEIVVACVDNYDSLQHASAYNAGSISKNIFIVCGYMFLVLLTMGLIFSSIAMILSTKLSTATTIGISIGIGVIIPITGMIGAFTQKQEFTQLKNQSTYHFSYNLLKLEDKLKTSGVKTDAIDDVVTEIQGVINAAKDPKKGIYNIGMRTNDEDRFDSYFGLDLNYQLEMLGALSTEDTIPDEYKQSLTSMGIMSEMAPILRVNKDKDFDYSKWSNTDKAAKDIFGKLVHESALIVQEGKKLSQWLYDNKFFTTTNSNFWEDGTWTPSDSDNTELVNVISLAKSLIFNPIGFFLSEKELGEAQKDTWNAQIDKKLALEFSDFKTALETQAGINGITFSQDAKDTYGYLMNIVANAPHNLIYTKLGDYVEKRTLFWCYLAFALGLVPISLLIMRKKDFR